MAIGGRLYYRGSWHSPWYRVSKYCRGNMRARQVSCFYITLPPSGDRSKERLFRCWCEWRQFGVIGAQLSLVIGTTSATGLTNVCWQPDQNPKNKPTLPAPTPKSREIYLWREHDKSLLMKLWATFTKNSEMVFMQLSEYDCFCCDFMFLWS